MNYVTLLSQLLPRESYDSQRPVISASLNAEAGVFERVEASSDKAESGITPFYAVDLLADWERVLALTPSAGSTYQQRQQRVLSKMAETGGLSISYFIRLAASMGYAITIGEPQPFRAGQNRVGDMLYVKDIIWTWTVNVESTGTRAYRFRAGNSVAGERLTSFGDQIIEAIFKDLKPAHTFCYFTYKGNL